MYLPGYKKEIILMKAFSQFLKLKFVIVFLICLFGTGMSVSATEGAGQGLEPISLNEILKDIIETNPEIIEAREHYKSVVEEMSIAKSGYYPKIGAEVSAGPEVTDGVDTNDKQEELIATRTTAYLRQNLYAGGETTAFVDETDARILAAAWEVIEIANDVFLEAVEAYINVLKAKELLEFSKQNVLTQEKILSQVQEKTTAGFTRVSDLTNSKARLALAKGNYISAQQDLDQAVVKFHRQFGRIIQPEQFVMPEPTHQFPETVEKTTDFAFRNHPALEVAKYNIHARKSGYERAKGPYYPSLDFELKATYNNDVNGDKGDTTQLAALLKLSYEFFDGGVRKGEKGKRFHFLLKEYQRAYTERRNVNQAVRLAWNIDQAEKVKQEFLKEHLSLSAETLSNFKDEYYLGRRTLLDLLNMENEFHSAKIANSESQYTNLIAYYRIASATGVMVHEFDTGLLKEMNLPTEKPYDLKEYEKEILNPNRDVDAVKDDSDQCDNSIKGGEVLPHGCADDTVSTVGYTAPANVSPYILPKEEPPEELVAEKDEPLKVDRSKDVQSISLNSIHFHFDSYELTDEAKEILKPIAEQLKTLPEFNIEIVGHTDSIASEGYNQNLSEQRAASVVKELERLGVNAERMTSSGKGELEPIADNLTDEGRAQNRRTEFILTK